MSGTPEQKLPEPTARRVWDQSRRRYINTPLHDLGKIFDTAKNPQYAEYMEKANGGKVVSSGDLPTTHRGTLNKNRAGSRDS